MIPTTDEMDHTTPEERNQLIGMCGSCGEWNRGDRKRMDEPCSECGGKILIQSVRSQRTFIVENGKKETAKLLRNQKK